MGARTLDDWRQLDAFRLLWLKRPSAAPFLAVLCIQGQVQSAYPRLPAWRLHLWWVMPERFALITGLLLDRPTCIDCLCEKSGMKSDRVKIVLARIGKVMLVHHTENTRCRACGEHRDVVSIDAPDDTTRRRLFS